MRNDTKPPTTIDEYISGFPAEIMERLEMLRETIRNHAPEAQEIISYQMPAFKLHRILVYFAAHKNHIGFYPGASGVDAFKDELSDWESSKGTIKFPNNKPLPLDLIGRIVEFRVQENQRIAASKKKK